MGGEFEMDRMDLAILDGFDNESRRTYDGIWIICRKMRRCVIDSWPTVHRLSHMFLHLDIQNIWHRLSVIFYKALRRWYSHVLPPGRYPPWQEKSLGYQGSTQSSHACFCIHALHIVLAVPSFLEQMTFCSMRSLIQPFHNRCLALAQQYCCHLRKKCTATLYFQTTKDKKNIIEHQPRSQVHLTCRIVFYQQQRMTSIAAWVLGSFRKS